MKFETRSIVQIECHSKHTKEADSLFTTIISFNTVRNEAKKANYSSHTIVDFYTKFHIFVVSSQIQTNMYVLKLRAYELEFRC